MTNHSVVSKRLSNFDWKTFVTASLFFLVALVNPRDFPVRNIPLIYPAFLLLFIVNGPKNIIEGFQRTKFLCVLIIIYWFYFLFIILIQGKSIALGRLAYLLEPLIIIIASGLITSIPGGAKAGFWALVTMITFSALWGLGSYFVGEPFSSLREVVQSSIGGNLLRGEHIRKIDVNIKSYFQTAQNTGLTLHIFAFSYQIAAGLVISIIGLLNYRMSDKKIPFFLLLACVAVLFLSMITNAERAIVVSVTAGLLVFFWIKGTKILKLRTIIIASVCLLLGIGLIDYTTEWLYAEKSRNRVMSVKTRFRDLQSGPLLQDRIAGIGNSNIRVRLIMPIIAVESLMFEPLGAGGMSDHYRKTASKYKWTNNRKPKASHNHFANVIMYTGIIGVLLVILLFKSVIKKLRYTKVLKNVRDESLYLFPACITSLVHSLTHNNGFFYLEPSTLIVFGLLWGSTSFQKDTHI